MKGRNLLDHCHLAVESEGDLTNYRLFPIMMPASEVKP